MTVRASALLGLFGIVLLVHNVVVQEPRSVSASVGNQRLFLGHFELERLAQEVAQLLLDFLSFPPCSYETKERIIRITNIVEPPVAFVVGIERWHPFPATSSPAAHADSCIVASTHLAPNARRSRVI